MLGGQRPQTLTPRVYLKTPSLPRYLAGGLPSTPGKMLCCVLDQPPSSPARLQKPTFATFSLPLPIPTPYPMTLPSLPTPLSTPGLSFPVSPTVCSLQSTFSETPRPVSKAPQLIRSFFPTELRKLRLNKGSTLPQVQWAEKEGRMV